LRCSCGSLVSIERRYAMKALVLIVFLAADTRDATVQREIGVLNGTWKVTAAEYKGKKMDHPPLEKVIFAKGKLDDKVARQKGAKAFKYRLDPGKSPKVIEATTMRDGEKSQKIVGIYEVADDTLKLCLVFGGDKPPAGFKNHADDEAIVLKLKREKR
jgi:uncharacterized protein (TIGR03067 family)